MGQIAGALQESFVPAFDGRPVPVIADQRTDHDAPALANRLQHDAGHTEYAIVIVGAEGEKCFGHYLLNQRRVVASVSKKSIRSLTNFWRPAWEGCKPSVSR